MRFSKRIVLLVIILNILFSAAILFVFIKTGSEPGVLVGAFFAFTTTELWSLATIKKRETDISLKEMDNVQNIVEDLSNIDIPIQDEENLEI